MILCRHLSRVPLVRSRGDVALLLSVCRKDDKDYALKQIEGTGISMSACREIAVRSAQLTLFLCFISVKHTHAIPRWFLQCHDHLGKVAFVK